MLLLDYLESITGNLQETLRWITIAQDENPLIYRQRYEREVEVVDPAICTDHLLAASHTQVILNRNVVGSPQSRVIAGNWVCQTGRRSSQSVAESAARLEWGTQWTGAGRGSAMMGTLFQRD